MHSAAFPVERLSRFTCCYHTDIASSPLLSGSSSGIKDRSTLCISDCSHEVRLSMVQHPVASIQLSLQRCSARKEEFRLLFCLYIYLSLSQCTALQFCLKKCYSWSPILSLCSLNAKYTSLKIHNTIYPVQLQTRYWSSTDS